MERNLARVSVVTSFVLCSAVVASMTASAQGQANPPVDLPGAVEVHRDVSPPLRDMEPKIPPRGPAHPIPLLHPTPGTGPGSLYVDPATQITLGPSVSTTAGVGFDGVGEGFQGYSVNVAPPDTNGAVGDRQYVQWVNLSFAVFDKTSTTGDPTYGPAAGNTIWSGFGGACESTNDGDVIAQYDKLANRWVMAQLSYSQAPPYLLCLAVSTTDDATGEYYRYSFSYSGNLNDYPKLGIWPDGYYVTANMFKLRGFFGYTYQGPEVCAFDRNSMLSGGLANPICKTLSSSYSSLLPADLDGTNPPPTGSPNYLLSLGGSSSLYLWKFKPDFTSGTSTLTGPTTIPVTSYNQACGGGTCIPQPGTSQQLDSLGDRLMYRLAYRNQGGTEILLANHSVATTAVGSNTVGVRWYEIHNPNGTPTVYQQSTWAPDEKYRWMGSIAMDKVGNIALGYSRSSSTTGDNPSIYYTGHQPSVDGKGVMEGENNIITGTGSQQVNLDRWGDYSSMSVDPVDDCTFWYTTEYLKSNGTFNWSTRVASFSFPSCTDATSTKDFSLSASPSSQTVAQGTTGSFSVSVSPLNGFSSDVTLSVTGCPTSPSGACTFSTSDVVSGGNGSQTLNVATDSTTTATTYNLTISATGGGVTHTTSVSLTVNAPAAADFSISASPGSLTLKRGSSGSYTVTITPSGGFTGSVAIAATCPTNVSCSSPGVNITSGAASAPLLVVVGSNAVRGNYTVNITGSGGGKNHSTAVGLKIR
jgi:hypothetical protein